MAISLLVGAPACGGDDDSDGPDDTSDDGTTDGGTGDGGADDGVDAGGACEVVPWTAPDFEASTVQNVTDEAHIAARRPFGARPGAPRIVILGYKMRFF